MTETPPSIRHRARVTFVGFERFWMDLLASGLAQRYSAEMDVSWMMWPSTMRERIAFVQRILVSDVVVRVGMPFEFTSETNRLWLVLLRLLPRLHGVNYWIGSDVLLYSKRVARGESRGEDARAIDLMAHFAGSEHLQSELEALGIPAQTVILPSPEREVPSTPPPYPQRFTVVAYLHEPQERFEFYGGESVLDAARALPDAQFLVVGSAARDRHDAPPNVKFLGRTDDMDSVYAESVVLVRLVEHDGVPSAMVEEALVNGRHVVYSFDWPHTTFVPFGDSAGLIRALTELRDSFAAACLPLNAEGRAFTLEDWDADRRFARLRAELVRVVE